MRATAAKLALLLLLGLCLWPACGDDPGPGKGQKGRGPEPQPAERREAHEVILAWLDCEECWHGELRAVTALGPDAVPLLAASLREGLSPARRAGLELQLRERYALLEAYRERHPERPENSSKLSFEEFVAHHASDARYRGRAALALGQIGTPEAEQALRESLDLQRRPSVEKAIREALATIVAVRQGR